MCASSCIQLPVENEYWTDEAIFMSLFEFRRGKPLPSNVTSDVNPYQYRPSDLPADLWYLWSGVKKDGESGFWQETGEACEIFSNSVITGSRTTLKFYEGRALDGRKTDWVMQEYRITEKCDSNSKDIRALCRVFLADEHKPPSVDRIAANNDLKSSIRLAWRPPNPFLEHSSETDCILRGDYFELNDLIDPGSRSSSSANSSCLTMTSDEYFDSMALLQEIENESVKFNLSEPLKSTEVIIRPATSVSLINDQDSKQSAQVTPKGCKSLSNFKNTSEDETKERVSGAKRPKMMKYLCFLAF